MKRKKYGRISCFTYVLVIDVLIYYLSEKSNTSETTVYREPSNNGIYLHRNACVPNPWKRETLITYDICIKSIE